MKIIKVLLGFIVCYYGVLAQSNSSNSFHISKTDETRIMTYAQKYLLEEPITITASFSERSPGGKHDFFSEGDYWWPDPKNPDGPYIRKDGMTNPNNFVEHRKAMVRLSIQVACLTAAYKITGDKKYANKVIDHLRAWFINEGTKMNPSLQYAQAIKGVSTGRGTGIIDTIHLIEVARSIFILEKLKAIDPNELSIIKKWFNDYIMWLSTSKNGIEEMEAKNNHGTCWFMQVAAFAQLTGDENVLEFCRKRFKEVLLPSQMGIDGSFPLELARTKPYSYSLFNLDAMATTCQILSSEKENLWNFILPDGRSMKKGIEFIYPFIEDKTKWTFPADVMYFEYFPNQQPALLFGGIAYGEKKYLELWGKLNPDPSNEEVIRNWPIRQPVLWIN